MGHQYRALVHLIVVRLGPSPGGSDRYLNRVVAGVIDALGRARGIHDGR